MLNGNAQSVLQESRRENKGSNEEPNQETNDTQKRFTREFPSLYEVEKNVEMQIYIEIFTGKTIILDVNSSDTVENVKTRIIEKERLSKISQSLQQLFFCGKQLNYGCTLAHYKIKKGYILHLVFSQNNSVKLTIETFMGNTFTIKAETTDTLHEVKAKIIGMGGLDYSPSQLLLLLRGNPLEDGTLMDNKITNDTILKLALGQGPKVNNREMKIFVKIFAGRTISLTVQHTDTVHDVKIKIREKEGLHYFHHSNLYRLAYDGQELIDSDTLCEYNIKQGSFVHLVISLYGSMQVFVLKLTGKTITFWVEPSDTVEDLMRMIEEKEGDPVHNQRLIFKGTHLESGGTLSDNGITAASKIHLVSKLRGD